MPPIIEGKRCSGCNICVEVCPLDVFALDEEGLPRVVFGEECWHCNSCVLDCPSEAISLRIPLPCMMLYKNIAREG